MDNNIQVLVDELTQLYQRYQVQSLQNDIMICLDILKYYDFSDQNNQVFIGYVLRVFYILKAKLEQNIDLTTDLSNLMSKGYTTGNNRNIFRRKIGKNRQEFENEVEFYVNRNYFDDEYNRLQRILLKNGAKLVGSASASLAGFNYEKILTNSIQLLDSQELALRLQKIVMRVLKPFENEKSQFLAKQTMVNEDLDETITKRENYLQQYNKLFKQENN
ncbi:hypothetical protein D6D54_00385 [Spiroplasma poulsonii]|uniref:Uncharacterized protein n=1 Tax=Spiroplasma poulsonii TaxID=2138 RepID=A0A3S0UNE4_9MOLU|nr:hypothetical protein [Spiroplasma poulsonii]MBW3057929.1 hypothetical protein [Spiroplasma poulsonii]RUP77991.1 hypothetical protein D6D54_00385 [Spiroplasma poulsonii]